MIAFCFFNSIQVFGQTNRAWKGEGGNSNWTNYYNWVDGVIPSSGDNIIIPTSVCSTCTWPDLPSGGFTVNNITFESGNGPTTIKLKFGSTNILTITGNFSNNAGNPFIFGDSTGGTNRTKARLKFTGSSNKTFNGTTLIRQMIIDKKPQGTTQYSVNIEADSRPEIWDVLEFQSGKLDINTNGGLKLCAREEHTAYIKYAASYTAFSTPPAIIGAGKANCLISQFEPLIENQTNPSTLTYRYFGNPVNVPNFQNTIRVNMEKYSPWIQWFNEWFYPGTYQQQPAMLTYYEPEPDYNHNDGIDWLYGWLGVETETETVTPGYGLCIHHKPVRDNRVIDWKGEPNWSVTTSFYFTDNTGEEAYNGLNLAGNPLPHPIDWRKVWQFATTGNVSPIIRVWRSDGGISNSGYYEDLNATEGSEPIPIAIGQGYFVQVDEHEATMTIDNTHAYEPSEVTTVEPYEITFIRKGFTQKPTNELKFEFNSAAGNKDYCSIKFDDSFTSKFDKQKEMAKDLHSPQQNFIYSLDAHFPYSIQARKWPVNNEKIALCIKTAYSGLHTISVATKDFNSEGREFVFYDKLTGTSRSLDSEFSYSFYTSEGVISDRFEIKLSEKSTINLRLQNHYLLGATFEGNKLLLNTKLEENTSATIQITDVQGRRVYENEIGANSKELQLQQLWAGTYVVRLSTRNSIEYIRCIKY